MKKKTWTEAEILAELATPPTTHLLVAKPRTFYLGTDGKWKQVECHPDFTMAVLKQD